MMPDTHTIYLVLTHTGTLFTRLIRRVTKDPFNHASIALDQRLQEVYSFGRRRPKRPWSGGFVQEQLHDGLFACAKHPTQCAVYACTVNESEYRHIRRHIGLMKQHQDEYKYNLLGLFFLLLRKEWKRENAYFCSQFVASVFTEAGCPLVSKPSFMVTPGDLGRSSRLELVYTGALLPYLHAPNGSEGHWDYTRKRWSAAVDLSTPRYDQPIFVVQ